MWHSYMKMYAGKKCGSRKTWYVLCSANGYSNELIELVAKRDDVVLM